MDQLLNGFPTHGLSPVEADGLSRIQLDTQAAVTAIGQIALIIAQINDTQTTIASAVEEQTATSNEMNRNITDVATAADQIASTVGHTTSGYAATLDKATMTSQAADTLTTQAHHLEQLTAAYTVS